jgi:hypothetical protein
MYRKFYPRIGLLAGLLAIVMMTTISTSAEAKGDLTAKQKSAARTGIAAQTATGKLSSPVNFTSAAGKFAGVFVPTRFVSTAAGKVLARGIVVGTVTKTGQAAEGVSQAVTMPVQSARTNTSTTSAISPTAVPVISCSVLHLVLGPLHLDLLGLVVDLNRVVLDITAVPAGGLLGQLLCSVANLLSGGLGGLLGQLATLLNQILGQLGL